MEQAEVEAEEIPKPGEEMKPGQMARLAKDPLMKRRRQAIADPMRMRILGLLSQSDGLTAKELAEKLRTDPNRLYYHLRILEEVGILEVADLRPAGRVTERVYKVVFEGRYIWDIEDPVGLASHLAAQLEVAKIDVEDGVFEQSRKVQAGEAPPVVALGQPEYSTTHDEIEEFNNRLLELVSEYRDRARAIRESTTNDLQRMKFTWVIVEKEE